MFKRLKKEDGLGIALALMALLVISLLGGAIVIRSISLAQVVNHKNYKITAIEAAKAGIAHAIYKMEEDIEYSESISTTVLNNYSDIMNDDETGYYSIIITNNFRGSASVVSPHTGYIIPVGASEIVSMGYSGNPDFPGGAKKSARIVGFITLTESNFNPFIYAAFGDEEVDGDGGSWGALLSDSYNSDEGAYSPGNANKNGHIGSNNEVNVNHKEIKGDVHAPEGGNNAGDYTGDNVVLPEPVTYPVPSIPSLPAGTLPPI